MRAACLGVQLDPRNWEPAWPGSNRTNPMALGFAGDRGPRPISTRDQSRSGQPPITGSSPIGSRAAPAKGPPDGRLDRCQQQGHPGQSIGRWRGRPDGGDVVDVGGGPKGKGHRADRDLTVRPDRPEPTARAASRSCVGTAACASGKGERSLACVGGAAGPAAASRSRRKSRPGGGSLGALGKPRRWTRALPHSGGEPAREALGRAVRAPQTGIA